MSKDSVVSSAGQSPKPTWHRVYYALGGFNVASVMAAIGLSYVAMSGFGSSVDVNRQWAERTAAFAEMSQTTSRADAPGNDVFESHDADAESAKLEGFVREWQTQLADARADLAEHVPADQRKPLSDKLDAADAAFNRMVREAHLIFSAFKANNPEEAGRHMATMDRSFSEASESLSALGNLVRGIQEKQFTSQLAQSDGLKRWEYVLAGLVLVIVAAIVAYGAKLAAVFAGQQAAIDARNRDMSLLLENVEQGFLTLDPKGGVSGERSAPVDAWLGSCPEGTPFWDLLSPVDAKVAGWFQLGWDSIVEDALPLELSVDQLPKTFGREGHAFRMDYKPLLANGRLDKLLVVITDVTSIIEQQKAEERQREILTVLGTVMKDRKGFIEFMQETTSTIDQLVDAKLDLTTVKRVIHTLKGNFAVQGLMSLSQCCHELENVMFQGECIPSGAEREALRTRWAELTEKIEPLLARKSAGVIEIPEADRKQLLSAIRQLKPHPILGNMVSAWAHEPVRQRFERIGAQAQALAERLGKPNLRVEIDHGGVRLDSTHWGEFWSSLPHVIRNAVDHGLESPEDRTAAGKEEAGLLRLECRQDGDVVELSFSDDGRGIDWDKLAEKAAAKGLPHDSREDLVDAMFTDDVSTRDQATETSGRGVGLAAVRAAWKALGGHIVVDSVPGRGTSFRFRVARRRERAAA